MSDKQTPITLTEAELNALKELRERYAMSTTQFGQLKIEKWLVENELERLDRLEEEFERQYDAIIESEVALVKQIEDAYGQGNVDLETGIFTPVQ